MSNGILIIGTAAPPYVEACLERYGRDTSILVNVRALDHFKDKADSVGHFGKSSIKAHNWRLWRELLRQRPAKVVVCCGEVFFHENVLAALATIREVGGFSYEIFYFHQGQEAPTIEGFFEPHFFRRPLFHATLALPFLVLGLIFGWAALVWSMAVATLCEGLLRLAKPLRPPMEGVVLPAVTTYSCGYLRGDRELGMAVLPNKTVTVTVQLSHVSRQHTAVMGTDEEGCRRSLHAEAQALGPEITILGGSNSFGNMLDDQQTMGWALQQALPGFAVKNRSVPAASSAYQLLLLRRLLAREKPPRAVVYYLVPRLERFITGTYRRPWLYGGPTASLRRGRLEVRPGKAYYQPGLAENSELVRTLAYLLETVQTLRRRLGPGWRELSEQALLAMRRECEAAGVDLLVATAEEGMSYYEFLEREGFNWVSTTIDDEGREINPYDPDWCLLPYEIHPSEQTHALAARHIAWGVGELLARRTAFPAVDLSSISAAGLVPADTDMPMNIYPLF